MINKYGHADMLVVNKPMTIDNVIDASKMRYICNDSQAHRDMATTVSRTDLGIIGDLIAKEVDIKVKQAFNDMGLSKEKLDQLTANSSRDTDCTRVCRCVNTAKDLQVKPQNTLDTPLPLNQMYLHTKIKDAEHSIDTLYKSYTLLRAEIDKLNNKLLNYAKVTSVQHLLSAQDDNMAEIRNTLNELNMRSSYSETIDLLEAVLSHSNADQPDEISTGATAYLNRSQIDHVTLARLRRLRSVVQAALQATIDNRLSSGMGICIDGLKTQNKKIKDAEERMEMLGTKLDITIGLFDNVIERYTTSTSIRLKAIEAEQELGYRWVDDRRRS